MERENEKLAWILAVALNYTPEEMKELHNAMYPNDPIDHELKTIHLGNYVAGCYNYETKMWEKE